jgi:cytochrome c biogenesis protein CcmG/thiol:disulfide interchange protein DsbE
MSESAAGPMATHPATLGSEAAVRRRRRRVWIVVASVVSGVMAVTWLLAFGLSRDPTVITSPLIGKEAPDFTLRTLDGSGVVHLSDLRGQVVVVNFWQAKCVACYVEHPALMAAWNRYRDQGVVVVGVDFEEESKAAMDFARRQGGDWPLVADPDGSTVLAYGVTGPPETFFIGRDGRIASKQIGPVTYALMTERISRLLESS